MVKATGSIRANQSVPKLNTSSGWPDGQRALERACYLMASRPKARNQVADFCSAPMAGYYAAVDTRHPERRSKIRCLLCVIRINKTRQPRRARARVEHRGGHLSFLCAGRTLHQFAEDSDDKLLHLRLRVLRQSRVVERRTCAVYGG